MTHDPSQFPFSPRFQERLRRIEHALKEGQARYAQAMESWARQVDQELSNAKAQRKWAKHVRHEAWRQARREARAARKAARRARREQYRNPAQGVVFALVAVALTVIAFSDPRHLWWMLFIAMGLGSSAAHHLYRPRLPEGARESRREGEEDAVFEEAPQEAEKPQPKAAKVQEAAKPEEDSRTARVDALCDKLMAELKSAPNVLREVVHQPEQTVDALRKSCHELARRERELRALCTPEDEQRLTREREQLAARVEAERDAVVKQRLAAALEVLDEQRRQRAELATAASRLEAEHTRLYYTLENLYAQVLRVRTADTASEDVAGAGLRKSLEQLGSEMDAVAEALEDVHRAPADTRVRSR